MRQLDEIWRDKSEKVQFGKMWNDLMHSVGQEVWHVRLCLPEKRWCP